MNIVNLSATPSDPYGCGPLLRTASWMLQRLPAMVVEESRAGLLSAMEGGDVSVEVRGGRRPQIVVRSGERVLVAIDAPLRRKLRDDA